jgi:hypothetical protein
MSVTCDGCRLTNLIELTIDRRVLQSPEARRPAARRVTVARHDTAKFRAPAITSIRT